VCPGKGGRGDERPRRVEEPRRRDPHHLVVEQVLARDTGGLGHRTGDAERDLAAAHHRVDTHAVAHQHGHVHLGKALREVRQRRRDEVRGSGGCGNRQRALRAHLVGGELIQHRLQRGEHEGRVHPDDLALLRETAPGRPSLDQLAADGGLEVPQMERRRRLSDSARLGGGRDRAAGSHLDQQAKP